MASIKLSAIKGPRRPLAIRLLTNHWGTTLVVSRGVLHDVAGYPGYIAELGDEIVGLVTYTFAGTECEITTLESYCENVGVGTALIDVVKADAIAAGCTRLWLITTNDNLRAIGFYQKRGFEMVAVHRHALDVTRHLKSHVPDIGMNGIPLRDEIEFEIMLA